MAKSLGRVEGLSVEIAAMGEKVKKDEAELTQKKVELKEAVMDQQAFKNMNMGLKALGSKWRIRCVS